MKKSIFIMAAVLLLCQSLLPTLAFAQYTKLLDFGGAPIGRSPNGDLISDGTFLYGMTYWGGSNDMGTIFKIMPDGTGYSKLLDFAGVTNGSNPQGSLISDGTFLYGMTSHGGTGTCDYGCGVIFKIKPNGTGYSKLFDFAEYNDSSGSVPVGSLISDGTFLYGTTAYGGTNNMGIIFKIKHDGTGYSKLIDFEVNANGSSGSLISDGTFLYGMTRLGGTGYLGTVFKVKYDGTGYSTILNFSGNLNGAEPYGSLISDGTYLYGMTSTGGTNNNGTIFKIKFDGTGYSKLFDFSGVADGASPYGSLISDGTFLFGMALGGGTNDLGIIFKIKPDGTGYSTLFDFSGSADGAIPYGSLIYDGTFLYGMTLRGGTNDYGVIFKIKPDGTEYANFFNFGGTPVGRFPTGDLFSDGTFLYGMTSYGGISGGGTIFKIKPDGTGFSQLFDFSNLSVSNGSYPVGSFISDGTFLYGMTSYGGTGICEYGCGVIFKIKPDGTGYSKLFDFSDGNGSYPNGSLISDGTFLYGMTSEGGTNNYGTLFKIKPDGTGYVKLLDFTGATNGGSPHGSLISVGTFLYGMTYLGGAYEQGTIFKIKPDGTGYSKLFDFSDGNGSYPNGSLFFDGTFLYGMTEECGDPFAFRYCGGVIFKIKPDGTGYSILSTLGFGSGGGQPKGSLISDGTFLYGMAASDGIDFKGTTFKIKPDGTGYSILLDFTGAANGSYPRGSLISDGAFLYGMTSEGGTIDYGTIFKYQLPCTSQTLSQTKTLCAGQSITVGIHTYTTSGNYTDVLTSYQNCDSTVTTHLTVLPANIFTQSPAICFGDSVTVGTHTYTVSGNYTDVLTSYQNCDSTVTTHLTILPANIFTQSPAVCFGDSVTVGTHTYTTSGNYTDVLTSYQNCDSTVTTHLTILPANIFTQSPAVCFGDSVTVGTHTYTASGNYTDVLTSLVNGCDSTVTTQLLINSVDTSVSVSTVTLTANATPATYQWIKCDNGNNSIAGQTNQSFTVSANGNYAVMVTQNNCSDTSSCYNIFITGIVENSIASFIKIYPNPFTFQTTITFSHDQKQTPLKIMNDLGKEIKNLNFTGRQLIIEKGDLPPGIYFLQVKTELGMVSKKMIINK